MELPDVLLPGLRATVQRAQRRRAEADLSAGDIIAFMVFCRPRYRLTLRNPEARPLPSVRSAALERTLFTLDWILGGDLRRRARVDLNKGQGRSATAHVVFFNRLGELRDRQFESQALTSSRLNLIVVAIIMWNPATSTRRSQARAPGCSRGGGRTSLRSAGSM